MRVAKAKRRWMRWCRYVDKTQSVTAAKNHAGTHVGQVRAYGAVMYAGRYAPIGIRAPWYPRWASARRMR